MTPPNPVEAIGRSLSIVRKATPEHPATLRILFYGQSISHTAWTDRAVARLRARYPAVTFDVRNLAVGGWSAAVLRQAAARDVAEVYPDLIVFHVYGDQHAYEDIIRTFRSRTAADVIVQTDHLTAPVEPLCDTGFHVRWSPPPGCAGHVRFRQRVWADIMSAAWIPLMARNYGLAVEPRRARWARYLQAHDLPPQALLADVPHPNERGWALMADLFTSWFEVLVERAQWVRPRDPDAVRDLAPPAAGETRNYVFEGNRAELIAAEPLDGRIRVTIDGKPPHDVDGCWQESRVSPLPTVPAWPAIRQVTVRPGYHQADRWTIRLDRPIDDKGNFTFTLTSARTGPDGEGRTDRPFTSASGVVTIAPEAWALVLARHNSGKAVAPGTRFTWERRFRCADQPPVTLANGRVEQRHVLATGLPAGRHVVRLTVGKDAPVIATVRLYRPPLRS